MPYAARKRGRKWGIVNTRTGKVAGYSGSKSKAQASARIRNSKHKKK